MSIEKVILEQIDEEQKRYSKATIPPPPNYAADFGLKEEIQNEK